MSYPQFLPGVLPAILGRLVHFVRDDPALSASLVWRDFDLRRCGVKRPVHFKKKNPNP